MKLKNNHTIKNEDDWLSVSDLMAGLMMVFLFISIALMREAIIERDKIKDVAVAYQENQVAIYDALQNEFEDDLEKWDATLNEEDLTFTFKSPDTLFASGESSLQDKYIKILNDFFPRYLEQILKFDNSINEIRIEGHTSSRWSDLSIDDSYFENMKLSQERTRTVLNHVYDLKKVQKYKKWIKEHIAAVGFSSSKIILKQNGNEDESASRRVTFRVVTNSEIQIRKILQVD